MKTEHWYEIKAISKNKIEAYIYDEIGGWGILADEFISELGGFGNDVDVDVRVNSPGGSVIQANAIFNALKSIKGDVTVYIDGLAASMASVIAMAGMPTLMAENALMMVHKPWGMSIGNAEEHRASAEMLDKAEHGMLKAYMNKTGMNDDEIKSMLADETWMTAEEAKAFGFIDDIYDAVEMVACFDISKFENPPEQLKALYAQQNSSSGDKPPAVAGSIKPTEEILMVKKVEEATVEPVDVDKITAKAKADALEAEKTRRADIKAIFAEFDAHISLRDELIDGDCAVDDARAKLLAAIGKGVKPISSVESIADERDKFVGAATDALMLRAGIADKSVKPNEFRGFSMTELAAKCLQMKGISTAGMSKMQIVGAAFTQSASDFPVLLENIMHKTLLGAYNTTPDTWSRFCDIGSVGDFRAHNRYRTGSIGNLDSLTELGEFVNKAIPDGEKATISIDTKGNTINISRQAVINDDLGALTGFFTSLGRAAKRTIESDVYTFLAANAAIDDGTALFHADHGNLSSSGAAIAVATLDAARVAMGSQQDISGNDYLDITPSILLCPLSAGGNARVVVNAVYDPDTANKLQKPNMVNGIVGDIVDTARITGNEWYLFADPNVAPVIEVAFLDGEQEPYLELENGFTVDGARYKVRHDFGIAGTDYRGGYKNAGA